MGGVGVENNLNQIKFNYRAWLGFSMLLSIRLSQNKYKLSELHFALASLICGATKSFNF